MKPKIKKSKKLGLAALAITTVATPTIALTSCGLNAVKGKPRLEVVNQNSLRKEYIQKVSNVADVTTETWVAVTTPTEITWTLKKNKKGAIGETIVVPIRKQVVAQQAEVKPIDTTPDVVSTSTNESIPWTNATTPSKTTISWTDLGASKQVSQWFDLTPSKTVVKWTDLEAPKKVFWTSLNASKTVVKWTDLSASSQASGFNLTVPSDFIKAKAAEVSIVSNQTNELSNLQTSPTIEENFVSQNTQPGQKQNATLDLSQVPKESIAWTNLQSQKITTPWTDLTAAKRTIAWTDLTPSKSLRPAQVVKQAEQQQVIIEVPKRIIEAAEQNPVSVVWAGQDAKGLGSDNEVSGISVLMPSADSKANDGVGIIGNVATVDSHATRGRVSVADSIQTKIDAILELPQPTAQDAVKYNVLTAIHNAVKQTETAVDTVSAQFGTYDWAKWTEEHKIQEEQMLAPTQIADQTQSTSNVTEVGNTVTTTIPASTVTEINNIDVTNIPVPAQTTVTEVLNPPKESTAWTDVNSNTNIQHAAWTDINTTTNVQHKPWTNIDLTTNVKGLYVGKPMPVTGSTDPEAMPAQYKANYAGADLFGQQLNNMGRRFTFRELKGLYLGYSGIKPNPDELYVNGQDWFKDVDAIVAAMNKDADISWHAIGEPYVDALNAVRYAIKKAAQGDSTFVANVRNVVQKIWWDRGLKASTTTRGSDFRSNAIVDINDWLLGKTQIPVIPSDNVAPSWGNPYDNYLNPRHIRVASDLATMKSVRFSEGMQKWAQYRVQQNEWRGSFDDHMVQQTTMEIGQHLGNAKGNLMAPNIKAPVVQAIPAYWAGENYTALGALEQSKIPYAAKWQSASEMNIYRGFCQVLSILYDETDYSQTGGHRYPMFDPQNDLVGYAPTFEALSGTAIGSNQHFFAAVPFVITEMWNSQRWDAPKGRVSTYVQDGYDDKYSYVYPYDLLGSGSLSIYYDGAEGQKTLDRLFTQK